MAVLKSWYVMLFYFVTLFLYQSYGDEKDEIEKSINTLLSLQGLATGYPVLKIPYDRVSLNDRTLENLQIIIDKLYNRLECGYLYSAQLHIKLTRYLIIKNTTRFVTSKNLKDFSFEVEATMMIDSFLDRKPDMFHDLWSLLVYARNRSILYRGIMKDNTREAEVLGRAGLADDEILSVIEKRITIIECAPDNSFNMEAERKSTGCVCFQRKTAHAMKTIGKNKQLLHTNFIQNRNHRLSESPLQSLSHGSLWLFRDKIAFKWFFEKFSATNSNRVEVQFPTLDFEKNLTGIAPLGQSQNRVIGTLKIIMLQITLSYANELSESEDILADAEKFNIEVLTKFQHLLVLEDDADFNSIIDNYIKWYDDVDNGFKLLFTESINNIIKTIKTKNDLPEIELIETDSGKTSKDIFEVGISFVDRIQTDIGEIQIRTVQEFLKLINETAEEDCSLC